MQKIFDDLVSASLALGAFKASVVSTKKIKTDECFRKMCESNACGAYGKCWMCPPDVGDIETLMGEVGKYDYALVYQTVTELEDSYDYEGMVDAKKQTCKIATGLRAKVAEMGIPDVLHLGAGGCGVCETCAKRENKPCRFPKLAMPSLEAYGVNVSELASVSGMKYINGADTVTYFGAVLFSLGGDR